MSLAGITLVSGDYFSSMKVPLLSGRFFTDADRANAPLVVIVNHKMAQHYWANQDPVGRRMRIGTPQMQTPWQVVVGEVADIKLASPDMPTKEEYYVPVE